MWLNPSSNHLLCLRTNIDGEALRRRPPFFEVIVGDFNAKIGPRRTADKLHIGTHGLEWNEQGEGLSEFIMSTHTSMASINWDHFASNASEWEDSVIDSINEEYNWLVEHLHDVLGKRRDHKKR
uniref:Endo/exonuclease/phosphatase domain-containing protein n=1 Tax=Haemonchus contortus TaxID=6289 RepID=A0A7I4YL49_HAECO